MAHGGTDIGKYEPWEEEPDQPQEPLEYLGLDQEDKESVLDHNEMTESYEVEVDRIEKYMSWTEKLLYSPSSVHHL